MHIEAYRNGNSTYLRLAESKRALNKYGQPANLKKIVAYLGPLSRFDDGQPHFLERLRESFRQGKPIIPELEPYVGDLPIPLPEPSAYLDPKNLGYLFLDALTDGLELAHVVTLLKSRKKIDYDILGLFRLLLFGRTLFPDSKIQTFNQSDGYTFPVCSEENRHKIYYTLQELAQNRKAFLNRLTTVLSRGGKRKTERAYYDVTNYYFEIDDSDPDLLDSDGAGAPIKKGLRKKGVSKENRKQPIVQMGLWVDQEGLPLSYDLFPGNTLDHLTLETALETASEALKLGRMVVVADRGIINYKNLATLSELGHGYVMSKSLKKCTKACQAWVLDPEGYHGDNPDHFRVKSRIVTQKVKNRKGERVSLRMKEVVYWSRRFYERELRENESFLKQLNEWVDNPSCFPISRYKHLAKYVDSVQVNRASGEVVDLETIPYVKEEKVREFCALFGYGMIVTSELEQSEEEIINTYRGLTRIESSFRVIKGQFKGRPLYVSTPDSIQAHFLTCFLSLLLMRLIQRQILLYKNLPTTNTFDWEEGLSAERVQRALCEFRSDRQSNGDYKLTKPSEDLQLIFAAFGMEPLGPICSYSQLVQFKNRLKKGIRNAFK